MATEMTGGGEPGACRLLRKSEGTGGKNVLQDDPIGQ